MMFGLAEKGRKGVYGLGSLWRIVWCMVIGGIGVSGRGGLSKVFALENPADVLI